MSEVEWGIQRDGRIIRCLVEAYALGEVARQRAMGRNAQLLVRHVGPWEAAEHDCPDRPDYPGDEAMAAIAAACTCPGCMTGGRCVDDPDEDAGADADDPCGFCPSDCQICSDTTYCDCPTHGGHDA